MALLKLMFSERVVMCRYIYCADSPLARMQMHTSVPILSASWINAKNSIQLFAQKVHFSLQTLPSTLYWSVLHLGLYQVGSDQLLSQGYIQFSALPPEQCCSWNYEVLAMKKQEFLSPQQS